MARVQQITCAGYTVEVVWECQFDKDILPHHPELKQLPIFQHTPLNKNKLLCKVGQIKCTVLPPKRLHHPVLPFRCNNKLVFCQCTTCALECKFSGEWVHESAAQRCLTATWVLDEIRLTIQKGYNVLDIIEVYEYEVINYDPQTRECGLFADYINTFLISRQRLVGTQAGFEPRKTRNGMLRLSMLEKACD